MPQYPIHYDKRFEYFFYDSSEELGSGSRVHCRIILYFLLEDRMKIAAAVEEKI